LVGLISKGFSARPEEAALLSRRLEGPSPVNTGST
jgi:hypothetical protein